MGSLNYSTLLMSPPLFGMGPDALNPFYEWTSSRNVSFSQLFWVGLGCS